MKPILGLTLLAAILATSSLSRADRHVRRNTLRRDQAINASLRPRATEARWTVVPGRDRLQLTAQTGRNDVRVLAEVRDAKGRAVPVTERKFNALPGSKLNPGYVAYTGYELEKKNGPYDVRLTFATPQGKPLPAPARHGIKYWISTEAHP